MALLLTASVALQPALRPAQGCAVHSGTQLSSVRTAPVNVWPQAMVPSEHVCQQRQQQEREQEREPWAELSASWGSWHWLSTVARSE